MNGNTLAPDGLAPHDEFAFGNGKPTLNHDQSLTSPTIKIAAHCAWSDQSRYRFSTRIPGDDLFSSQAAEVLIS
jgi:hypothetical protein